MTVKEEIKKANIELKGIYFRSIRNGETVKSFSSVKEMNASDLNRWSPGSVLKFGRLFVDVDE